MAEKLPEGVEYRVVIEGYKNGINLINTSEPDGSVMHANKVRQILLDSFIMINEEICINKAFVLLDDYLKNIQKQNSIISSVRNSGFRKPS